MTFKNYSKRTDEIAVICVVVRVFFHKGRLRWGCKHSREYKLLKRNPWNQAKREEEEE